MREIAKVVKIENHTVLVEKSASSICGSCGIKDICNVSTVKVRVLNPKEYDISVGDMIEYEAPKHASVTSLSALLYGIPIVILLILTISLKKLLGFSDYLSLGIAAVTVGIYYWALNAYSKKRASKFLPYIVKKVSGTMPNISSITIQRH